MWFSTPTRGSECMMRRTHQVVVIFMVEWEHKGCRALFGSRCIKEVSLIMEH